MSFKEAQLQTFTNDTCANLFAYETVEDQADITDYYSSMVKAEYIPYNDRIFWSTVTVNFNRLNAGTNVSRVWLRLKSKAGAKGRIRINNEIKEAVPDHFYMNPLHVHISGDDGFTKVDLNGKPIQGNRPMTPGERKAFNRLYQKILKYLSPWIS